MRGIYPDREAELVVGDKTYKLRFGMRELVRAENVLKMKALAPNGVNEIIKKLLNESLDSFLLMLQIQLERYQPDVTSDDVWAIADVALDEAQAAVYSVLNLSLPRPDPNEQPAAPTPTATPEMETIGT